MNMSTNILANGLWRATAITGKATSSSKQITPYFQSIVLTMICAISGGTMAADYSQNPFTLVYGGAITANTKGEVNIHPVTYKLDAIAISANVYTPANHTQVINTRPSW